jgi:hypothetical protein
MLSTGLITTAGTYPDGKQNKPRLHYAITHEGAYRLKTELQRYRHLVKIATAAGHFSDKLPPDIRKILEQLR